MKERLQGKNMTGLPASLVAAQSLKTLVQQRRVNASKHTRVAPSAQAGCMNLMIAGEGSPLGVVLGKKADPV